MEWDLIEEDLLNSRLPDGPNQPVFIIGWVKKKNEVK